MAFGDDLRSEVQNVIDTKWNTRTGTVVPTSENVALKGGAVEIEATFLYADLAHSSKIAKTLDRRVAAKIFKSFLSTSTRLIKSVDGTPISFDGDRVLGVFIGEMKNTRAAKVGLHINYVMCEAIRPKFNDRYESVRESGIFLRHGVGIDTGTVLVVRGGVHGTNDLISIGRAANLAAKLSDRRDNGFATFITSSVYNKMTNAARYSLDKRTNMWTKSTWSFLDQNIETYKSGWWRKP